MQVQDEVSQPRVGEPIDDGVDSRALLGDEERGLPVRGEARDEVGDGLALAGSRRAMDDQVPAGKDHFDRGVLGGVGIQDDELLDGGDLVRRSDGRVAVAGGQCVPCSAIAGERGHDVMGGHEVMGPAEIVHHGQLLVVEEPHREFLGHGEPWQRPPGGRPDRAEHVLDLRQCPVDEHSRIGGGGRGVRRLVVVAHPRRHPSAIRVTGHPGSAAVDTVGCQPVFRKDTR